MVKLEVCVDSLESAINAIHGGAEELEVCSSLTEGGLTPTVGLVKQILHMVQNIGEKTPIHHTCSNCKCAELTEKPSVNIMIRCRAGSDFCYTPLEVETMLLDLVIMKNMGVNRFVFGALTSVQEVDVDTCAKIIAKASPLPVTFHRAFDICKNTLMSIEKIVKLGFDRVLTSGQRASVDDPEAFQIITDLMGFYQDKIHIMPGAGISIENVKKYVKLGCPFIHSSCKTAREAKIGKTLNMGIETAGPEKVYYTDKNNVIRLRYAIKTELLRMQQLGNAITDQIS
ncbi:PF03932 family protein CutC isoform X2 [Leguminivora glycinivorella]|uniref:PF03932 family protein CutC isoform X2 n=1 Tax=Leguminivora glycinivorella TaxID=1035111 RepID=UPI00200F3111|nr:PF03932 family protein CutC isoform X2 [Leguminivora glycinivorella]